MTDTPPENGASDASSAPAQDQLGAADIRRVMRMIPHRYPFLLVDRVERMKKGDSCVGVKNVTANEPQFTGHFPDEPIMPGVLIVESLAQTAAVLVVETLEMEGQDLLVYFMTLDKCRFRNRVVPGDRLELRVRILRGRGRIWKFWGEAWVDDRICAEAEYSAMIVMPDHKSRQGG
jgi:3-hydroxyacyl-[acyl-carrier-protein] dehydratase